MNYNHDDSECFCRVCGNSSIDNKNEDMCKYCYDDSKLLYYCILCNNYFNYINIENVCYKYIESVNIIKRFFKLILKKNNG
jgi:hypothetical protein